MSVPANIAEGSARSSAAEKRRYFEIARSSLVEVDTLFEVALELSYSIGNEEVLDDLMNQVFAMLSGMIKR